MTERDVQEWLESNRVLLERARDEVTEKAEFFFADWVNIWNLSYEQIDNARIKDAFRICAKSRSKGLVDPGQLLTRCHDVDGHKHFPVHDLVGVRVLVLSLNDVDAFKRAVEDLLAGDSLYPLGNTVDARAEDINEVPRIWGYRALHIDGSVTVRVEHRDYEVPFEIQVKTLAQHVFGQHTHDEAYVPDRDNNDPRYNDVRGLQKALAETLNGADMLLARIEDVSIAVRGDIARRKAGSAVSSASVANTVRELFGRIIRDDLAASWARRAHEIGLTETTAFAELIDPSRDPAADFAERFRDREHRRPADQELIGGLLGEPASSVGALQGPDDERIRRRLAEPLPANPLDELDPDVDLTPPDQD
jgi:ppGpp synthetase/RelA/SpoT-type nucleotidyltranferase